MLVSLLRFTTVSSSSSSLSLSRGYYCGRFVSTTRTLLASPIKITGNASFFPCFQLTSSHLSPSRRRRRRIRRRVGVGYGQSCFYHSTSSNHVRVGSLIDDGENDIQIQQHSIIDDDVVDDVPDFPIYYNDVYEVDLPPGHRFPMGKYRKVREAIQAKVGSLTEEEQSQVHCEFRVSPLATEEQLITTHDSNYVQRYLSGDMTNVENRNIGFPWSVQGVNRTLSSVGGTVAAACAAWEEYLSRCEQQQQIKSQTNKSQQTTAHLCWGAHVAGGTHHAFRDYGEGFCIFSDIAVAANVLLQRYSPSSSSSSSVTSSVSLPSQSQQQQQQYPPNPTSSPPTIRRILIIDLDVHQGNGNAALFATNPAVQTFSMHCSANYFSKKERSDLDVELPSGCDDGTYLSTLRHWLKRIEGHSFDDDDADDDADDDQNNDTQIRKRKQFDFIFYQSGVDIHANDRLGRLSVTSDGISKRNAMVFDFANRMECPLVVCMGGGYPKGEDWTSVIEAHANVYWEAHRYLADAHSKIVS